MSRADLRRLIGRPYQAGADGPESFDCYGAAAAVLRVLGGRELPPRGCGPADDRRAWARLARPLDGAVVLMGAAGRDRHIGVFLAEGGVIHALERLGVVFDDLHTLRLRGFSDLRFYGAK